MIKTAQFWSFIMVMTEIGYLESSCTTLVGKIGNSVEQQKMGFLKHFRQLCWEKIGKSVESFCTTLVGNDWKKYRTTKIEHCLYICFKNVTSRVCQKLSLHIYYL